MTNIIHKEWTGLTVKEHKNLKSLRGQNLRDNWNTKRFGTINKSNASELSLRLVRRVHIVGQRTQKLKTLRLESGFVQRVVLTTTET